MGKRWERLRREAVQNRSEQPVLVVLALSRGVVLRDLQKCLPISAILWLSLVDISINIMGELYLYLQICLELIARKVETQDNAISC